MSAKISVGVPYYGQLSGEWSFQTMQLVAGIAKQYTLCDIIPSGVMTADHNRNLIVEEFLKSDAEWLFWIDSDTTIPMGAVERMLAHGRTLVSGLYYGKHDPHPPIAYHIYNGAYAPLDQHRAWEVGEIIEVDSSGMGCALTHRSVFEDIKKSYKVMQGIGGNIHLVHQDDFVEEDVDTQYNGKVVNGFWSERLSEPKLAGLRFPFFMIEHVRTEDMFFFEKAARVNHKLVLDTSVECGHLRWEAFKGEHYRNLKGH
jgi:hypothetical protein